MNLLKLGLGDAVPQADYDALKEEHAKLTSLYASLSAFMVEQGEVDKNSAAYRRGFSDAMDVRISMQNQLAIERAADEMFISWAEGYKAKLRRLIGFDV
jgi:hypothetical protein